MSKRTVLLFAAILVCGSLSGCLIIPTDYYKEYSRQNISEDPPETILPGVTTREGVLQILGEPDNVSLDESEIWYIAEKVKAWLIVGRGGSDIVRSYVLIVRFNGKGIVESKQLVTIDTIPVYQLEPHFSRSEAAPLQAGN